MRLAYGACYDVFGGLVLAAGGQAKDIYLFVTLSALRLRGLGWGAWEARTGRISGVDHGIKWLLSSVCGILFCVGLHFSSSFAGLLSDTP